MTLIYLPPAFALTEFDESHLSPGGGSGDRWLASWQGASGFAAEEVVLGWYRADGEQCVVATADRARHKNAADRRRYAALLVLGGLQLRLSNRPKGPSLVHSLVDKYSRTDDAWSNGTIGYESRNLAATTSEIAGVSIGYVELDERLMAFATVGLDSSVWYFRNLGNPSAYACNPTEPHTVADLARQATPYRPEVGA
jgi:hypothetical protein